MISAYGENKHGMALAQYPAQRSISVISGKYSLGGGNVASIWQSEINKPAWHLGVAAKAARSRSLSEGIESEAAKTCMCCA